MGVLSSCFKGYTRSRNLNGFEWFWSLGGAGEGGTPVTAQNEKGSADSLKAEGTPPGESHFGVMFGSPDVADTSCVYHWF